MQTSRVAGLEEPITPGMIEGPAQPHLEGHIRPTSAAMFGTVPAKDSENCYASQVKKVSTAEEEEERLVFHSVW